MPRLTKSVTFGFVLAFVPMVASQLLRLEQTTALGWLLCDYAGRIGGLLVLAAIPATRAVAFRMHPLRTSWWEAALWIAGLVLIYRVLSHQISSGVNAWIPHTAIGHYIAPQGWLNAFDLSAGLLLVAYHEEIIFRRCARAVFGSFCGEGTVMVLLTALLFAAYHWTTGLGNIVVVFFFGIYTMLFLKRTGALWPVVLAHFLFDFIEFY